MFGQGSVCQSNKRLQCKLHKQHFHPEMFMLKLTPSCIFWNAIGAPCSIQTCSNNLTPPAFLC